MKASWEAGNRVRGAEGERNDRIEFWERKEQKDLTMGEMNKSVKGDLCRKEVTREFE